MKNPEKKRDRKRFRLIILNENTLDTLFSSRISIYKGILYVLLLLIVLAALLYLIFFYTPFRKSLPGYLDAPLKSQMISDVLRIDSLSDRIDKDDAYMAVLKGVLSGTISLNENFNKDTLVAQNGVKPEEATSRELSFRKEYEETEKFNLTSFTNEIPTDGLLFYTPVKGKVSRPFSLTEPHYGIDVKTRPHQTVLAVLDGRVMFAAYTPDYGYVLYIQHNNDFVSVYRQMTELLKKEGDYVKAGEAVAFTSRSTDMPETSYLHFELWSKSQPLNPEDYIVF